MRRRAMLTGPVAAAVTQLLNGSQPDELPTAPLSPEIVDGLVNAAAHYRRAYHSVPAAALLPAAHAHLRLLVSLKPSDRLPSQRAPLLTALGEMATLAAVLLALDAADRWRALNFLDLAWSIGLAVDDVDLQTVVLGCRSFALSYRGGNDRLALACVDHGRQLGRHRASAETRAWVAAVASERCASLRDDTGSHKRLDESRAILADRTKDEIVWRGVGGFDTDKQRAYEGGNLVRLGKHEQAEKTLTDAINGLGPAMYRHRSTALIDRAHARLAAGELDGACDDARNGLVLVRQVQHLGNLDRLSRLAHETAHAGHPDAHELQQEIGHTRTQIAAIGGDPTNDF